MDCNKDEALRAKSIAETKLEQSDYAGSKKFALKAQNLYPGLNGIPQMLTSLEVYISAEKKISGLPNWYSVLGVDPSDDDEKIKKQYRKLALLLHPDKNNSAGAEGAFKLISEAWTLLSDKAKRWMYDQTTGFNLKGFQQKSPMTTPGPAPSAAHTAGPGQTTHAACARASGPYPCTTPSPDPSMESLLSKIAKRKPPTPKAQKKRSKSSPVGPAKASPIPPVQMVQSFWTICAQCRIQYEYHTKYHNTTLLCPTCNTLFVAAEIPRRVTKSKSHKSDLCQTAAKQQQQNSNQNPNPSNNLPAPPPSGPGPSTIHTAGPGPMSHPGGPSLCTVPQPSQAKESSFSKYAERKPASPKSQKKRAQPAKPVRADPVQTAESFWTICAQCGIRYEYHMTYRNITLLCITCKMPFLATEIPRPVRRSRPYKANPRPPAAQQQQQKNKKNASGKVCAPPPANNCPGPNIFTNPTYKEAPPPAKVPNF